MIFIIIIMIIGIELINQRVMRGAYMKGKKS